MNFDSSYDIKVQKKFPKWITKNLPDDIQAVFLKKLTYFSKNPRHPSLNTKLYNVSPAILKDLKSEFESQEAEVYEFYINDRDYRCIVYVLHDKKQIILAYVGDHNEIRNRFT